MILSKVTSSMQKAGVEKVFQLLINRNSLEKGINTVLRIIPNYTLTVIESNFIRKIIEHGIIFLCLLNKSIKVHE